MISFNKKYEAVIKKSIKDVFGNLLISKSDYNKLKQICANLYYREIFPDSGATGVVIAGFGKKDTFPSLKSYEIICVANNRIKYREGTIKKIGKDSSARIIPFAQTNMVETFIEGVDPNYYHTNIGFIKESYDNIRDYLIKQLADSNIDEKEKNNLISSLENISKQLFDSYIQKEEQWKKETNIDPIMNNVQILPKEELAELAEALVSVTSFKKRFSMDDETVGGPIDVAVISKGDGFVWIKRKHYFKPELNHHYFSNYYVKHKN